MAETEPLERLEAEIRGLRTDLAKATVPEHLKREPQLQYLSEAQLAERLSCGRQHLQELRRTGGGPKFIRLGQRPLYSTRSVLEWEQALPRDITAVG